MRNDEREITEVGDQSRNDGERRKTLFERIMEAMALNEPDDDDDYFDDDDEEDFDPDGRYCMFNGYPYRFDKEGGKYLIKPPEEMSPARKIWRRFVNSIDSLIMTAFYVGLAFLVVIGLVSLCMFGVRRYLASFAAFGKTFWYELAGYPWEGFSTDSESTYLSEAYRAYDDDFSLADHRFENDGEFLSYLMQEDRIKFYPSNDWTIEEVIDYARNASVDDFALYLCEDLFEYYLCFTPDFEHCFMLESHPTTSTGLFTDGWVYIDGVKVGVLNSNICDLDDPDKLISKYQSGEWDGSRIYSPDLSTSVVIYDLRLNYSYERSDYGKAQDPQGIAYTDYDRRPWWMYEDLPEEPGRTFYESYRYPEFVDLPVDYDGQIAYTEDFFSMAEGEEQGAFLTTDAKLQIYCKGELRYEWDLTDVYAGQTLSLNKEKYSLHSTLFDFAPTRGELAEVADYFLYNSEQLYALQKSGDITSVFEKGTVFDSVRYGLAMGLKDHEFLIYDFSEGKKISLDQEVLDVSFGELTLYEKAEGCYLVHHDLADYKTYTSQYLGPEDFDYYLSLKNKFIYSPR